MFNILTDVLFAILPIPLIWKLQINKRTRITLIAVLSLGWFACAAATLKAVLQYTVPDDPDWTVHDSFNVWNYIELTVGIVAASLPSLKPLFHWALHTVNAISSSGRTRSPGVHSVYVGARSLGYCNMSQDSKGIQMQSINGKGTAQGGPKRPYNVHVTTHKSHGSLEADQEAWDVVKAKESTESTSPIIMGPKDIMLTTEIHIS